MGNTGCTGLEVEALNAPLQPMRRARTKATTLVTSLKRIAKADERTLQQVAADAGIGKDILHAWPVHALPTLASAMALADAVGYEIVLRRKPVDPTSVR